MDLLGREIKKGHLVTLGFPDGRSWSGKLQSVKDGVAVVLDDNKDRHYINLDHTVLVDGKPMHTAPVDEPPVDAD